MTPAPSPSPRWRHPGRAVVPASCILAAVLALCAPACSSSPHADPVAFCRHYRNAAQVAATLSRLDTVKLVDVKRQLQGADTEAADAARLAPKEVAPDVRLLAGALHDFRTAVDAAQTRPALYAAAQRYQQRGAAMTAVQRAVDRWTSSHCGFAPDTAVAPTTAPAN